MTDRKPEPNPDSRPRDEDRGSIETLDRPPRPGEETPDADSGAPGGTDGVVRNQDSDAQ